jgi:hypothetical protein
MTITKLAQIADQYGSEYQGYPLLLKALDDHQLFIVVSVVPDFRVRLSAESDYSKKVDQMGISDEAKVGDSELDDNYVIRSSEADQLPQKLTSAIRNLLKQLSPFVEYEQTAREYRLLKDIPDNAEATFQKTLETLVALVRETQPPQETSA